MTRSCILKTTRATFDPIYTRKGTDAILPTNDYPGMGDFLRGATVNGYVHEPWGIAQACDETLPAENNELLKEEISKGSHCLQYQTGYCNQKRRRR